MIKNPIPKAAREILKELVAMKEALIKKNIITREEIKSEKDKQ